MLLKNQKIVSKRDRLGRCPHCGAKCFLPCIACQIRQQTSNHFLAGQVALSGFLEIELRGRELRRYKAVRAKVQREIESGIREPVPDDLASSSLFGVKQ